MHPSQKPQQDNIDRFYSIRRGDWRVAALRVTHSAIGAGLMGYLSTHGIQHMVDGQPLLGGSYVVCSLPFGLISCDLYDHIKSILGPRAWSSLGPQTAKAMGWGALAGAAFGASSLLGPVVALPVALGAGYKMVRGVMTARKTARLAAHNNG